MLSPSAAGAWWGSFESAYVPLRCMAASPVGARPPSCDVPHISSVGPCGGGSYEGISSVPGDRRVAHGCTTSLFGALLHTVPVVFLFLFWLWLDFGCVPNSSCCSCSALVSCVGIAVSCAIPPLPFTRCYLLLIIYKHPSRDIHLCL